LGGAAEIIEGVVFVSIPCKRASSPAVPAIFTSGRQRQKVNLLAAVPGRC
jgi:hypothetical protein